MSFWGRFSLCSLTALTLIAVNGCLPSDSGPMDEEKEPHYVLGKSRVNAMDYDGAIEAFDESLEADPHSAAAHFQLAWLFDTKKSDPAAAIYHYQEYLRLNPKAGNAVLIQQRIYSCKQQLAADVLALPGDAATQRKLEDLAEKNRQLQDEVDKWRAYYAARQAALKAGPVAAQNRSGLSSATGSPPPDGGTAQPAVTATPTAQPKPAPVTKPRTYTVAAGETFASIARKSGVSLTAIQAANPGINPRKLRVGQTVNLP